MKVWFLLLLFILSLSVHAKIENYRCTTTQPEKAVELGLTPASDNSLLVNFEQCALTSSRMFDVCKVSGHKLVIPVNPKHSLLVTGSGEQLDLSCAEHDDEPVVVPEPTEPEQEEPESEEDTDEADDDDDENNDNSPPGSPRPVSSSSYSGNRTAEPGHGGSNVRMRGILTDDNGIILIQKGELLTEEILKEIIHTFEP